MPFRRFVWVGEELGGKHSVGGEALVLFCALVFCKENWGSAVCENIIYLQLSKLGLPTLSTLKMIQKSS